MRSNIFLKYVFLLLLFPIIHKILIVRFYHGIGAADFVIGTLNETG